MRSYLSRVLTQYHNGRIGLLVSALAASFFLSITNGRAADAVFRESTNWIVNVNIDDKICFAFQKGDQSRGLRFARTPQSMGLFVFDKKLSWVEDQKEYRTTVYIDSANWTGLTQAWNTNGAASINFGEPTGDFLAAIMAGNNLSIIVDGTNYGPYSLSGTRKVMSDLVDCIASTASPDASAPKMSAAESVNIPTNSMLDWDNDDLTKVFASDGISVRLTSTANSGNTAVHFTVEKKDMAVLAFEMPSGATPTGQMGFFNIGDDDPKLVLTTYTGGAHCCTAVRIVDFSNGLGKVLNVGAFDGDAISPEDIDRDGHYELALRDERFLYVFEGYAGSFPPAMILTVKNGELKDVTRNPEFAAYNQSIYEAQSEACGMAAGERPGACAGLAATASILGVLPETLRYVDFTHRPNASTETIKICDDQNCRRSKDFADYRGALFHALDVWGYRAERPDPQFSGFMRGLVGRRFGEEQGSEMSCEMGATAITEAESPLGSPIFEFAEYEQGCAASNGVLVGSSVVLRVVCQGEGDPQRLERRIYSLRDSILYRGSFNNASALDGHVFEMKECSPQASNSRKNFTVKGQLQVGTLDSVIGDYMFTTDSDVGKEIFPTCQMGDICNVSGVAEDGQIVEIRSVSKVTQ